MNLTLRDIACVLGGEVSGDQVLAPGPGHSRKDRSLSVKLSPDAPDGFIVHSFSGDDPIACKDYVRQRLGLPAFKPNNDRGKHTIYFEYRDPISGDIRYRKKRIELADGTKTFVIEPKGRGGSSPLLYGSERLADITEGQPVFIVEGEKKVDRLSEFGAIAVCADAGAKSKWLPGHAELLRGLDIILWPDSDDAGERYIESAAKCLNGHSAGLRVVRPFGLPNGAKGKDVCDWQGDANALAKLAESAAPYAPAQETKPPAGNESLSLENFYAYMPMHSYIFVPSREMWPASSVNSRLPRVQLANENGWQILDDKGEQKTQSPATWLDQNRPVETMTWAPGEPMLIGGRLVSNGGWIAHASVNTFNLYRPPDRLPGDAAKASPWVEHGERIFAEGFRHIKQWLAHRVQRPYEKINHALVLGGCQGIGKDTLLEPLKYAVGPWNFAEVTPQQALGRFNGFLKSVILRISEARDLGDVDRFKFYDHMKSLTAAPPDVLRVDEKHLREYSIFNCCGVIVTTNHKTDGIYLPEDDRRHFVAWNDSLIKEDFTESYWNNLWAWYESGGHAHVAAYLGELDLSGFNPKAPPPKTAAFWDIVDANRAPEESELADVLDRMGTADAVTLDQILRGAIGLEIEGWLRDRKNRRSVPYRLEKCGYVPVRNDLAKDGLWKIKGARQVVYARHDLPARERLRAARKLTSTDA
jgi:hypothetical protein